ncbi:MAG TPA: hypothetical protein VJJ21_00580 [Candidatus Nanoarchaeia archaeon]|nr:hypothetical protein [Candidatus Nanoarchaeia archaeon]
MNKKGAELSFNIIIILIILVVVLVILVAFFTGSFAKLLDRINKVSSDNLDTAISDCSSKCGSAQTYTTQNAREKSAYCRASWKLDADGDGIIDKDGDSLKEYRCWEFPIEEDCAGVRKDCRE